MPLKNYSWFLIFVISCNYEPDGIFITKLEPPSTTGISITLDSYDGDQILLNKLTKFDYRIITNGKSLIESRVYFNNQAIWTSSNIASSFELNPESMTSGSYILRIEAELVSGSGSMAEKLGAEIIKIITEKTVIVDNDIPDEPTDPDAIAIVSVENYEGTIKISWNRYNKSNFQHYVVSRNDIDENGVVINSINFNIITDANQIFINDYSYLWGRSIYYVTLAAANKTYKSPGFSYEHPYKPVLFTEISNQGDVKILWPSISSIQNNFGGYKLDIMDDSGGIIQTTTFEKTNVIDTVVVTNIPNFKFGKFYKLKLSIYSYINPFNPKIIIGSLNYGDPFPDIVPLPPPQFNLVSNNYLCITRYVVNWSPRLSRLSSTGMKLDSLERSYESIAIASKAQLAAGVSNGKTYLIDLEKMEEIKSIDVALLSVYGISNDATLLGFDNIEGVKVYSSNGQSLLTMGFIGDLNSISPDGRYITGSNKIYKFNGISYDFWSFFNAYGYTNISYLDHDPTRMIISYPNRVVLFNLETKSEEQVNNNFIGPCNYDPLSKKIGCRSSNSFVVLNPYDLSLHLSIDVSSNNNYFLLNETLICSGASIKLSELP